jgi:hypothetical protein
MTPLERLEVQREQERAKRQQARNLQQYTNTLKSAIIQTAPQKITGLDRLSLNITDRIESLRLRASNQIVTLAQQLTIDLQGDTSNTGCPNKQTLTQATQARNNLVKDIEGLLKYINTVDTVYKVVGTAVQGTVTSLTAINTLKIVTSAATKSLPVVPGILTTLLADLDDIRTILTFTNDGNPRLPQIKQTILTGQYMLTQAIGTLQTLLKALQKIDSKLQECGETITALPATELIQIPTPEITTSYKGFYFTVASKPYTENITQLIGQARNKQGIVLLQTEPSFTTNPQTLVDELILVIDRDDLKAD